MHTEQLHLISAYVHVLNTWYVREVTNHVGFFWFCGCMSRQQLFRVPFFDGRSRFLDANANANTLHLALSHFLSLSLPLSLFNSYITHIYSYHVSKSGAVANNIQRFTNTQVHFALEYHAVFLYGGGGGGSSGRPPPQSQRCLVGFLL